MKARHADKETLHTAIRKAIEANHGRRISYRDFLAAAGFRQGDIFHHYARWEEAVRGAGFKFKPYHRPVAPGALLAEWGAVVRKLRRLPSQAEYRIHGPRAGTLVGRQFGSWHNLPAAFRKFARHRKEWSDVLKLLRNLPLPPHARLATRVRKASHRDASGRSVAGGSRTPSDGPSSFPRPRLRFVRNPRPPGNQIRRMRDRPCYGDQLDIPSLRHAPSNEQGVIYLFGIMADSLGFSVERMQPAFPDCKAKRRTGRSLAWQDVLIEFEYASRNFHTHRHNPSGCDIIVCWTHNWPDCPKNIEVIALDEELKRLTRT